MQWQTGCKKIVMRLTPTKKRCASTHDRLLVTAALVARLRVSAPSPPVLASTSMNSRVDLNIYVSCLMTSIDSWPAYR